MAKVDIQAVENLIEYSPYFEENLISVKNIRNGQEEDLVREIIDESLEEVRENNLNKIQDPSFFIGSVDFMVNDVKGEKKFSIIESNGGSSRGLSALQKEGWKLMYDGLLETLKFTCDDPLILIGHPNGDMLLPEKIFLAENFRREANIEFGGKTDVGDSGIAFGSYEEILPRLDLVGDTPHYEGDKVDVVIGDGIVRRKNSLESKGKRGELNAIIANEVFPETDDKSLTYETVKIAAEDLEKYGVYPLDYWVAEDKDELFGICKEKIDEIEEIVIKPYGGSGGCGIDVINKESEVISKVENSLDEFYSNFGVDRNPYHFTVCEKVNFCPITWKGTRRNFDLRIYVARKNDELIPCGGLARIALEPLTEVQQKKSFVVNLSGYEGIDVSRGLGISEKALDILELSKNDFVDLFSASVTLFKNIIENHEKIIQKLSI